jgi:outer membrane protein assembly factor BamB
MKDFFISKLIPAAVLVVCILLFIWLVRGDRTSGFSQRLPGLDGRPENAQAEIEAEVVGTLETFDGAAAELEGSWPCFRGENLDIISTQDMPLAQSWPDQGPPLLWDIDLGEGYAGAAVHKGRVYIIDYDRENQKDAIRCLSLADGGEIWRYSYPINIKRNHGMSRTVPAVNDNFLVALGPKCHLTCLDSMTGELIWKKNLVAEFDTEVPQWYAGQCPIIEGDRTIIAPAGSCMMMAVDLITGDIIWETPNPDDWEMTHSSILPVSFMGKDIYIYCAGRGVVGVAADTGELLFKTDMWKIRIANVPSPVDLGEGRIFFSGGYNAGSMFARLYDNEGSIDIKPVLSLEADTFGSAQQTPVFFDGYIYGVRPDGQLVCLDTSGRVIWTSSGNEKFGLGPYMVINSNLYLMNDSGVVTIAAAQPSGYQMLARAKLLEGPDSWAPMAVADGRLLLRDLNRMVCVDITEGGIGNE